MSTAINQLKVSVFVLTFISYATYTGTRLSYSTTKSVLNNTGTGYAPFNSPNGSTLLGILDTVFLSCYAAGLFISGMIGDRVNIKHFLVFGMTLSGIGVILFGLAPVFNIHSFSYFVVVNIISGLAQSTGWPSLVTIMSRYFGHNSRGTVFGIWNSHGSIGSIIFKLLCNAAIIYYNWRYAFIWPGLICISVAILLALFLDADPKHALTELQYGVFMRGLDGGRHADAIDDSASTDNNNDQHVIPIIHVQPASSDNNIDIKQKYPVQHKAISVRCALVIPGVITYSICLAFSKFIAYSFILWLPFYLSVIGYNNSTANNLSAIYDVGGIFGGIIAGYCSDRSGMRGLTCMTMLLCSVPTMYIYMCVADSSEFINGCVMLVVGILTLGPYTLVSSAVAADLGNHVSLHGNTKAMATVTGMIDSVGSIGGACSGVTAAYIGNQYGWNAVLYVLMITATIAALCLTRVVYGELHKSSIANYVYLNGKEDNAEQLTPKSQPLLKSQQN